MQKNGFARGSQRRRSVRSCATRGFFGGATRLRFGGTIRIVPDGLRDGPIWRQALGSAFGAEARVGLAFDDTFDLTARVNWAPQNREWGVKLTFTLLRF